MILASTLLKRAVSLISKPVNWTQGKAAATITGRPAFFNDPKACRWCGMGALAKVFACDRQAQEDIVHDDTAYKQAVDALYQQTMLRYRESPGTVNDTIGHSAILLCMAEAARTLESQGR